MDWIADVILYALYGQLAVFVLVGVVTLVTWWDVPIRAFFELARLARDARRQGRQ